MSNFLAQLLGVPQAQAAPAAPDAYSPALERRARANGFKSAAEMMAWANQRNQKSGGTIPAGGAPGSVQAGMNGAAMMHPKNMLGFILQKWQDAMGGN